MKNAENTDDRNTIKLSKDQQDGAVLFCGCKICLVIRASVHETLAISAVILRLTPPVIIHILLHRL